MKIAAALAGGLLLVTVSGADAQAGGVAEDLMVQGSVRLRVEDWNWFGAEEEGEYRYLGGLARLGLSRQGSRFGWQVEAAAPFLLGLPQDAALPPPRGQLGAGASYAAANDGEENVASVFLKQVHMRFGAAPGSSGHGARLGRFDFAEGAEVTPLDPTLAALKRDRVAHRLLGNFAWSHVQRSLDGIHYAYTAPRWNATAVAARPTQGVSNVDGWPGLDIGVGYGALTLRDREGSAGEARVFVLHYSDRRDWSRVVKSDNRPLPERQGDLGDVNVTTLGGHYARVLPTPAGSVDVLLWGAGQAGDWGELGHEAWAGAAEVGIQPPVLGFLRPWLRMGHLRSSGDGDPGDQTHETFFQVLPTPRIYARTPLYNLMNSSDTFVSLALRPSSAISLRADLRAVGLESAADLWYGGGGAFEGDSFGFAGRSSGESNSLATLFDISGDYRFDSRLSATLYFGFAQGGGVVEVIHPDETSSTLGYLELQYRH